MLQLAVVDSWLLFFWLLDDPNFRFFCFLFDGLEPSILGLLILYLLLEAIQKSPELGLQFAILFNYFPFLLLCSLLCFINIWFMTDSWCQLLLYFQLPHLNIILSSFGLIFGQYRPSLHTLPQQHEYSVLLCYFCVLHFLQFKLLSKIFRFHLLCHNMIFPGLQYSKGSPFFNKIILCCLIVDVETL